MEHINYRNIGIMAHIDAGKTTLTERILYVTGKKHNLGEVHHGNTDMDWMEQEKERGITITSAATTCFWKTPHEKLSRINIIDTPGHVDFTIEVERSLRVLDGAVVVLDSVAGVEPQTETVWRQADNYKIPRLCFVNKMDKAGSDFENCLSILKSRLSSNVVPLQIPFFDNDIFRGVIDIIDQQLLVWPSSAEPSYKLSKIPDQLISISLKAREALLERIAEVDDDFASLYLSDAILSCNNIRSYIRKNTLNRKLVPAYCGSAYNNIGVQLLLNAIVYFLPSPTDKVVRDLNGTIILNSSLPLPNSPKFLGLAFKIMSDSFVGNLTFVRIYSGVLTSSSIVKNTSRNFRERVGRMLLMHANNREDIKEAKIGDIVALVGLKNTTTGDTLCDIGSSIVLERIEHFEPVVSVAVTPETNQDQDRMNLAIAKLTAEDPSLSFKTNPETSQIILSGMGELHLDIIVNRMRREFKVNAEVGFPQVSYRETLSKSFVIDYLHKKQTGGAGQFARVKILFEPQKAGTGFTFLSEVVGGHIPKEYISSIEKGISDIKSTGTSFGYPIIDFKATLLDGEHHSVDSSSLAFEVAARNAFAKAAPHLGVVLLEPIMKFNITTPDCYLGDLLAYISSIRGKVLNLSTTDASKIISSTIAMSETIGFANRLRSITQGRAQYTMKFSSYSAAPSSTASKKLNK